jgi:predicted ATPase/class 3 adenylate cyclase/DNA-binding XRE family transcriptional regulator
LDEVSFGEWLKRRRKAQGLTQEELALKISCSASALRKFEAEQRRPSEQIIEQLADIFNIPSSERKSFLKFARGHWDAAPTGVMEDGPWRIRDLSENENPSNPRIHLATFLFTDIESSTKLWERAAKQMKIALQRHHDILQEAISSNSGAVFQILGDAFCAAFPTAPAAVAAAITAQRAFYQEPWDLPFPIRVRMGIHTGEAERTSNNSATGGYASSPTMNRVARILKAGHGGQVLVSLVTKALIENSLPTNIELRDMGEHHLKNFAHPEHLFQLHIAGLPSDFPPLNTLGSARHNLPLQLTSFIGREKEIADVIRLLEKTRLVTLTGSGGTGKTRLSVQVVNKLLDQYPNGVWMVELAPILDPLLLPRTIAIGIGLRDEPQRPVIDVLCDYLREKKMLIILDNCEHLIEACAQLAHTLLHACPHIRILASSREALGIAGEASYLVPSLILPEIQHLPSVESLSQYEAIQLFIDRSISAVQTFTLTNENASSIAQICQRLDGIPLAIELAAARVKVMSVQQIAARLDNRFLLLKNSNRVGVRRHQTLQAAIDWSHDILNKKESALFRRLAVFSGGWSLEAAEAVSMGGDVDENSLLDLLTNLVEKSLVVVKADGQRYGMLETVRQYAQEKLIASGEAETYYEAHLNYFLKLAEDAEPHLKGAGQIHWINRLEEELDNLRIALDRAASSSTNQESGLKLSSALWRFWQRSIRAGEGRTYLARLLNQAAVGKAGESLAYAKAFTAAGALAYFQSDYVSAQAFRQEALDLFRKLRDPNGIADSLHGLGNIALSQGNYEIARSMYEESLAIRQKLGQREPLAGTLSNLGLIAYNEGDYITARSLEIESYIIFQEFGNRAGIGFALNLLGNIARHQGDLRAARRYHEESIACCQQAADQWGLANALNGLADVTLAEGDLSAAYSLCRDALNLYREGGAKEGIAYCLESIATIAVIRRHSNKSVKLLSAAAALRNTISLPLTPTDRINYERNMVTLHSQLDDMAFKMAWEEGMMMPLDQVIEYALSESL